MATPEQIASRKSVDEFLSTARKRLKQVNKFVKSEWFGRPDKELLGWIERGRAIHEIEDTMGYRLIMAQTDKEILWAQSELEIGRLDTTELRAYLKALRFLKAFILETTRNADISSSVLAGRAGAIANDSTTFIRNARVEGASN